jgi:hypothetical protein
LATDDFQRRAKASLAAYKHEVLGVAENGIWRKNRLPYPHILPILKPSRVRIGKASLVLLSRQYRFGDRPEPLFETVDVTGDVLARAAEFDAATDGFAATFFHDTPPEPRLGPACRDCGVFGDVCLGAGLDHTVLEIPGLQSKKLLSLAADGIVDLADLPDDLKLNQRQQRAVKSSLSRQLCVENGLGDALNAFAWPCHYLDFETVATVLPLYDGHGRHQQVLTQFSIHHRNLINGELRHSEYLADATEDCQRELAEALIRDLGHSGSVMSTPLLRRPESTASRGYYPIWRFRCKPFSTALWIYTRSLPITSTIPTFAGASTPQPWRV